MPLVPVLATAAVAAASTAIGMAHSRWEAKGTSIKKLESLRSRHMVMGGGLESFQVRTIDQELLRRRMSGLPGSQDGQSRNDIMLAVHIDSNNRVTTKTSDMNTMVNVAPVQRGELM